MVPLSLAPGKSAVPAGGELPGRLRLHRIVTHGTLLA